MENWRKTFAYLEMEGWLSDPEVKRITDDGERALGQIALIMQDAKQMGFTGSEDEKPVPFGVFYSYVIQSERLTRATLELQQYLFQQRLSALETAVSELRGR